MIEFGTGWCGYCQAAQPLIAEALADRPDLRHLKIEDGKGRPLGRSFRVNLWPTLIVMAGGQEVGRVVRPHTASAIRRVLDAAPRAYEGARLATFRRSEPRSPLQPGARPVS